MRPYELVMMIRPEADEARLGDVLDRTRRYVNEHGGRLTGEESWGKRRLAYKIGRHAEAIYHLFHFEMDAPAIKALESNLNLQEEIIRYLVSRYEPVKPAEAAADAAKAEEAAKAQATKA